MSISVAAITERVKQIEQAVAGSLGQYKKLEQDLAQALANHNAALGALEEAKNFLGVAVKVANAVAPANPVTDALDAVDTVAEALIPDEPASPVSAPASSDASSSDEAASS